MPRLSSQFRHKAKTKIPPYEAAREMEVGIQVRSWNSFFLWKKWNQKFFNTLGIGKKIGNLWDFHNQQIPKCNISSVNPCVLCHKHRLADSCRLLTMMVWTSMIKFLKSIQNFVLSVSILFWISVVTNVANLTAASPIYGVTCVMSTKRVL